jgi:EAL domain-containing protein (putative c-di-GMP-specific phosphodiesterase class I)
MTRSALTVDRSVWIGCGVGLAVVALSRLPIEFVAAVTAVGLAAASFLAWKRTEPDRGVEDRAVDAAKVDAVLVGSGLEMHYQPIVWMPTGEIVGYEALARFASPPPRPDQWFAMAERCGKGIELEVAAVRRGLMALRLAPRDRYVSVNVSPETLLSDDLLEALEGHPGRRVVLEMTEHVPIADYDVYLPRLTELRGRGVRLAVDDAGAGYSSLRHILILRPEIIKLDRTLTTEINHDPVRRALLTCLATFAHATKTTLVAEGIETVEERTALIDYGVAFGQGYYFHRPAAFDRLPLDIYTRPGNASEPARPTIDLDVDVKAWR